ncbi:hypothetical protein PTUN_a1641 [Pseudoalteromonas tunicata]|uniref:Uncharacterized protein n=1 Tax=Pseudoalteromonas tunicata D2 TaxID=87626 RepID=A4CBF2_9GAMM|nr:hypothetical protein PTUN_a1641 [Pseudoalteromonas tunicata]EAR27689.1 hypothetical protein PTD2_17745 [Pseudoalteromonas tunicata D2]
MVYFHDDDLTAIALTNNDTQHPGPALTPFATNDCTFLMSLNMIALIKSVS